ncbi:MAG: hypothetical protein J0M11_04825 [Anaerolineae bacterium]|nr:hypothetical protein [Anaerolineae bacterium]
MMIKKIFLALFGLFIIAQAIGSFAWGSYLRSQVKPELISEEFPSKILVDSKDQLWIQPWADSNSQDARWEVYKDGNLTQTFNIKNEPNFPSQIVMDTQGNLFGVLEIGSSEIRVMTNEGTSWNELTTFTREYAPPVNAFAAGSRDDIWIGGIGELIHYDGSKWQTFTSDNSPLPSAWIYTLFVDSQKRLWIGTGDGIAMIDNGNFQPLPDSTPRSGITYSFAESSDGTIWAGGNGGMYSYDGSQWSTYNSENSKLRGKQINDIEVDSSNRVWALPAEGGVLSVWDGTTMRYMFGEPGNLIRDIEIGPDGNLYMMRTDDVSMLRTDIPLIDPITLKFLWLLNNGIFIYLSIFLVTIWIALAMNSWGVGLGPALGGLIFWGLEAFYLFDINGVPLGYINPGFTITIITFLGGLIGYFFKRRGTKHADLIGGGIGCVSGGILTICVLIAFVMLAIATGA